MKVLPAGNRRKVSRGAKSRTRAERSEEHTSELQSPCNLVCRLLLEKKKQTVCAVRRDVICRRLWFNATDPDSVASRHAARMSPIPSMTPGVAVFHLAAFVHWFTLL